MKKRLVSRPPSAPVIRAAEIAEQIFATRGWTYGDSGEPPTKDRLIQMIESLLSIVNGKSSEAASGRFIVRNRTMYESGTETDILLDLGGWDEYGQEVLA